MDIDSQWCEICGTMGETSSKTRCLDGRRFMVFLSRQPLTDEDNFAVVWHLPQFSPKYDEHVSEVNSFSVALNELTKSETPDVSQILNRKGNITRRMQSTFVKFVLRVRDRRDPMRWSEALLLRYSSSVLLSFEMLPAIELLPCSCGPAYPFSSREFSLYPPVGVIIQWDSEYLDTSFM